MLLMPIRGINRKQNPYDTPTKNDSMITILYPKRWGNCIFHQRQGYFLRDCKKIRKVVLRDNLRYSKLL